MKKVQNIISLAAALTIASAVALTALVAGAFVCSYFADAIGIAGRWETLALVPVMFLVAAAVTLFFLSGLKKYAE